MSLLDETLIKPSRRVFLKQTATVASGLAIALYLPSGIAATDPKLRPRPPNSNPTPGCGSSPTAR